MNELGLSEACVTAFLKLLISMSCADILEKRAPERRPGNTGSHHLCPPDWLRYFFTHPIGRRRRGLSEALLAML